MTMTHEAMLAGITRELVRTEIQIHAQNPEMALGMAMARRIMERQYAAQFVPYGVQTEAGTANEHPTGCNADDAGRWK